MNILIASDSHGRADRLGEAVRRAGADVLLFLGDGLRDLFVLPDAMTVRAVRGNCDFFGAGDVPLTRLEIFGKYRVFLTHGHTFSVKSGPGAAVLAAARADADVLLYGHTHVPYECTLPAGTPLADGSTLQRPLLVVCPGSVGEPQRGEPTFATLTLRDNGILAGFGKL
ncbi:MAG: YfcE family phosphodiesterase [Ruminococcaceae bacterium]|nr:YfcE family phosphodiesterase [Oscillospiraceae bacterium]